jgi:rhamnosyltransferase
MRSLFIVGSQGIPADYGGLETFADETATRLASRGLPVYVTCEKTPDEPAGPAEYKGVSLLYVEAPDNNLRTIIADVKALWRCYRLADPGDVVYLLGYGVGPFAWPMLKALKAKGVKFWLNPDGLEWKRPRWPAWARFYLRISERFLLHQADRVICDAAAIQAHHQRRWGVDPSATEVIEYGAPIVDRADLSDAVLARRDEYLAQYDLAPGEYYTYVGRFVPDNNLELMVRGMLDDRIERRLLIFAKHDEEDPFFQKIRNIVRTSAHPDKVIFTGGVYDQPLLQALRLGEHAYFHGHEVGGTNPALVEAMGLGSFILALNTVYNREVLGDAGLFFGKSVESFVQTVTQAERLSDAEVQQHRERAADRVRTHYNWERIADEYERLLLGAPAERTAEPKAAW